jgi:putative endonuclease
MYFVYLLRSIKYPDKVYIGYTENLEARLKEHNLGNSLYTSKYTPWEIVTYVGFRSQIKAIEFEQYLKSGSGSAFALKRFW